VTGAGTGLVAKNGNGPVITSATVGKVIDMGLTDPMNMGGAMAPAASDTIIRHLKERNVEPDFHDLIVTGELGKIGGEASVDHLYKQCITLKEEKNQDSGFILYKSDQPLKAGRSGTACSAVVTFGHLIQKLKTGKLKRVLCVA